jgi:hypothetical protein
MHLMCGLENSHPAGSWNGWMMKSDCIMDRPPMVRWYRLVSTAIFNKLWTIYFYVKNFFFNNGPYGEFDVNL